MKNWKAVVIVVCLLGAGLLFWSNSTGSPSIPDTVDSSTTWMCAECKNIFELTAAQAAVEEQRAGGPSPLICPKCSKHEAYRVATCDVCGGHYFSTDVPGGMGRCLDCFPPDRGGFPEPKIEETDETGEKAPPSV